MSASMSDRLKESLKDISSKLYDVIDDLLPDPEENSDTKLVEAMRYSSLAPGKRLRPFLTVTTAKIFGVSEEQALQTAAAIEFVHTYSLIHDDLPSMDDDDMRRGQLSCHKKYDEATAILAGDALLTYAFEVLADRTTHGSQAVRCELIRCLAKSAGSSGMVRGQMLDMLSEKKQMSLNEITHLQRLKTGELFTISCDAGAILGNAPNNLRNHVRGYANDIGLAFQITDDLLDADTKQDNRDDKSSIKATFVNSLGVDKAKEQAKILANQANSYIKSFGKEADLLRDLAEYIVKRKS